MGTLLVIVIGLSVVDWSAAGAAIAVLVVEVAVSLWLRHQPA